MTTATEHTEPSIRDMWQEGLHGTLWLDTTVTRDGSPVSVTFRYVLGYGLVTSDGNPVTYDVEVWRAYHAVGTNVPDGGPWHPVVEWERFETQDGAQRHAEGHSETVGNEWDFGTDALYHVQVQLVSRDAFIREVAALVIDEDPDDAPDGAIVSSDDAWDTLRSLIERAKTFAD